MNDQKSKQKWMQRFRQRAQVQPLTESVEELSTWFHTPMGKALLSAQKKILSEELNLLFGYHLMQLSILPESRLYSASRVNHCFSLAPKTGFSKKKVSGVSDFQTLPLPDESIDVTILHHVLEFSENPQQVLKEAARVTISRGYIVLMGFNPWSFTGLSKNLAQYYSNKKIWHRHSLRVGRVKDWLNFLDFSTADPQYSFFNLPINSKRYLRNTHFLHKWNWSKSLPFGTAYCLVARKDTLAMTPLKPKWETPPVAVREVASKRAIKSGSTAASAMVLPMRKRNPQKRK